MKEVEQHWQQWRQQDFFSSSSSHQRPLMLIPSSGRRHVMASVDLSSMECWPTMEPCSLTNWNQVMECKQSTTMEYRKLASHLRRGPGEKGEEYSSPHLSGVVRGHRSMGTSSWARSTNISIVFQTGMFRMYLYWCIANMNLWYFSCKYVLNSLFMFWLSLSMKYKIVLRFVLFNLTKHRILGWERGVQVCVWEELVKLVHIPIYTT